MIKVRTSIKPGNPELFKSGVRSNLNFYKPEERELIVLKYIQEYGYDTVADMLGCTVQAAKVRSLRAREKLKEILQRFGVEP